MTIVFRLCYTKYVELVVGPAFSVLEGEKKKDAAFRSLSFVQNKKPVPLSRYRFWSEC